MNRTQFDEEDQRAAEAPKRTQFKGTCLTAAGVFLAVVLVTVMLILSSCFGFGGPFGS